MKKMLSTIVVILMIICFSGCEGSSKFNNESEGNNKIDTFGVDNQSVIKLFEETGRYVETNVYEFENDEKNTCGTIRLNPDDYDNLYADECIYTQVRTYENKVFSVLLTYDISGDELYYIKLSELANKVLSYIKPNANIKENFLTDFDVKRNDYYSKDFEDLRYIISYKEWGLTETRVEITIVHIVNE